MTKHGAILALLTLLFSLRVLGQMLVAFFGVAWLPPMPAWFSGLIPYPTLLTIQLVMLILMTKIVRDVWRGDGFFARTPSLRGPRFLVAFSALYAASMVARYVITMASYPEMRWFGGAIPISFHFVLAGFLFVLGRYYGRS
ncbi:MAG: hypothetical protein FJ145_05810 [Deltaproteobacteria bacterium]|nr:hypothetical protein [Deltaproteobacteria bacterium]